jgi:hypothetical protein
MKSKTDCKKFPIGCYIDGANQNQTEADARLVRLAESFGMVLTREQLAFCQRVESDCAKENDYEFSNDFAIEAETYLNETEPRAFLYWSWENGDFGLWPNIGAAKEDCEFVSSQKQETPANNFVGNWLHINDHGNVTLYYRENGIDSEVWSVV